MGKKSARRSATRASATRSTATAPVTLPEGELPVVGGREPCPCGSGRRYKACHGRAAGQAGSPLVARSFAGLRGECDWVALREIVPSATAPLTLAGSRAEGAPAVTAATVLPMAWPGLRRDDGDVLLGLQVPGGSGDASRDIADVLLRALDAEPGTPVGSPARPAPGPRLQDILDADAPLAVTVHEEFDFWLDGSGAPVPEVAASLERANAEVVPTLRLVSVEAAYWCRMGERVHLRWVLPDDEEPLLDAMARLHAVGADRLREGGRYVGSFRAHGLLVPVWDLPAATTADDLEDPAGDYAAALAEALADAGPLTALERRARSGLVSRQLTLR